MIFKVLKKQCMDLFSDISIKNILQNISFSIKECQAFIYQRVLIFHNLFSGGSYNLNRASNIAVSALECSLQKVHFPLLKEEPYDDQYDKHGHNHQSIWVGCQGRMHHSNAGTWCWLLAGVPDFSKRGAFTSSQYGSWVPKASIQTANAEAINPPHEFLSLTLQSFILLSKARILASVVAPQTIFSLR